MATLFFIVAAIILRKKQGAVIALLLALIVDVCTDIIFTLTESVEPVYIFYVGLFLIVFAWWIITCCLNMTGSQIVSGVSLFIMSVVVLDCYFANGYETIISIAFPYVVAVINAATILAAWHDRNWAHGVNCLRWSKCDIKDDKADTIC